MRRARLGIISLCALASVIPSWSQAWDPVHPLGSTYGDFGGLLTFLRAPYVRDLLVRCAPAVRRRGHGCLTARP
jgi:hypothetical protein